MSFKLVRVVRPVLSPFMDFRLGSDGFPEGYYETIGHVAEHVAVPEKSNPELPGWLLPDISISEQEIA